MCADTLPLMAEVAVISEELLACLRVHRCLAEMAPLVDGVFPLLCRREDVKVLYAVVQSDLCLRVILPCSQALLCLSECVEAQSVALSPHSLYPHHSRHRGVIRGPRIRYNLDTGYLVAHKALQLVKVSHSAAVYIIHRSTTPDDLKVFTLLYHARHLAQQILSRTGLLKHRTCYSREQSVTLQAGIGQPALHHHFLQLVYTHRVERQAVTGCRLCLGIRHERHSSHGCKHHHLLHNRSFH